MSVKEPREKQLDDLGTRIADGISEGMARLGPRRKVRPGSSEFDPRTPFQSHKGPDGTGKIHLKGNVYDNGIQLDEQRLYDEEILLCNQIVRSGDFINELVTVVVSDKRGPRSVFIKYGDGSVDQKMENKNHWRSLLELLQKIVAEQNQLVLA